MRGRGGGGYEHCYSQTGQNLFVKTRTVNNPTGGVEGGGAPLWGALRTPTTALLQGCPEIVTARKITHVATAEHKVQSSSYNKLKVSYNVPASRAAFF